MNGIEHKNQGFSFNWSLLNESRCQLDLFEAKEKNRFTGKLTFLRQLISQTENSPFFHIICGYYMSSPL